MQLNELNDAMARMLDTLTFPAEQIQDLLGDLFGGVAMPSPFTAFSESYEKHLTSRDIGLIEAFLRGDTGPTARRCDRLYTLGTGRYLYTCQGSYELLIRCGDVIVLNIDVGILVKSPVLASYRQAVLDVHKKLKGAKPLIVAGTTAMSAARITTNSKLGYIHQDGLESVFTRDDEYWLSAYDSQESPPLYFLCRLPGRVKTIAEARESLKPESVCKAEKAGLIVRRQGDLFAIQSGMTDRKIKELGGRIIRTRDEGAPHSDKKLYGTSHTATFIARLPSGMELACETMRHDPTLNFESRAPDHRPLELGDAWWWVAKNTVPVQKIQKSPRNPFLDRISLGSETYTASLERDQRELRRLFIEVASQNRRRW